MSSTRKSHMIIYNTTIKNIDIGKYKEKAILSMNEPVFNIYFPQHLGCSNGTVSGNSLWMLWLYFTLRAKNIQFLA
ncbi:MAG: hypothetical protein ACOYEJ_06330 [Mahellales bacterium]